MNKSQTNRKNLREAITLRSYRPKDEKEVIALYHRAFGKPIGQVELDVWKWKYPRSPVKKFYSCYAWHDRRMAGHYAAVRLNAVLDGREISGALAPDTMVDPDYHRLGLFSDTASDVYSQLKNGGVTFLLGFPNGNSIHGALKLGWRRIAPMPVSVRVIDPAALVENKTGSAIAAKPLAGLQKIIGRLMETLPARTSSDELALDQCSGFGTWVEQLWRRCAGQHRIQIARDYDYLRWRYNDNPINDYTIFTARKNGSYTGAVVVNVGEFGGYKILWVLDLLADLENKGVAEALIDKALEYGKQEGAQISSALVGSGSAYKSVFRRKLFLPVPEKVFPQDINFAAMCYDESKSEIVFDPSSWNITWGDTDLL